MTADCDRVVRSSVHRNGNGSRRDSISDDDKLARAQLLICRDVEMSRHESARCNGHAAVIRVYDAAGNVIETHEHAGEFKE